MDVRLSVEQRALRDAVAQLVDRSGPDAVADLQDGERQSKLDAAVAAAGWRGLRGPGDNDGPWATAVEPALVAEELGRGLADASFIGPTLAAELRRLAGAPETGAHETVTMAADLVGAAGSSGVPSEHSIVVDAHGAQRAIVLLAAPGGYRLGEVDVTSTGVDSGPDKDLTRACRRLDSTAVGSPVEGQKRQLTDEVMAGYTAFGLALTCADLVGVMRGAIALASDYARVRRQYGAAIGSFQAVQHLLADAHVAMEGSRSVAVHAAWAVDALPADEALAAAAVAKAYCARAARQVCETSIQVHGGIGNTWDCLAHVYLRRALFSIDWFGGVGVNLDRVAKLHPMGPDHGLR
jgi:alkylation response protein AidB-like acyl-CoA dehydrogenase